jgi:hypothetical protein
MFSQELSQFSKTLRWKRRRNEEKGIGWRGIAHFFSESPNHIIWDTTLPVCVCGEKKKRSSPTFFQPTTKKKKCIVYFRHRHLQLGKLQLYILLVFGYRSNIRQGEKVYESCRKRDWNFITPFFYFNTCLVISSFSHRQQEKCFKANNFYIYVLEERENFWK